MIEFLSGFKTLYTGKIEPQNQAFKILIIDQRSSNYLLGAGGGGDATFVSMFYTIDSVGEIIASVPFAEATGTIEEGEEFTEWYMNGSLNEKFEIQTTAYTMQRDGESIDENL